MKVIYVSGKLRASSRWQVYQNIARAAAASLEIWKLGHMAFCPHLNDFPFEGELPDDVWLAGDMEMIARSDALLMLEGWGESEGATLEHQEAKRLGIKIYYSLKELKNALYQANHQENTESQPDGGC